MPATRASKLVHRVFERKLAHKAEEDELHDKKSVASNVFLAGQVYQPMSKGSLDQNQKWSGNFSRRGRVCLKQGNCKYEECCSHAGEVLLGV